MFCNFYQFLPGVHICYPAKLVRQHKSTKCRFEWMLHVKLSHSFAFGPFSTSGAEQELHGKRDQVPAPCNTFLSPDIGSYCGSGNILISELRKKTSPDNCLNQLLSEEGNTSSLQSCKKHVLTALLSHQPGNRHGETHQLQLQSLFPKVKFYLFEEWRTMTSLQSSQHHTPETGSSSSEQQ